MPSKKLKEFLDKHEVPYVTITHSQAFTAQKVAASAHIPGKNMVKTVMVAKIASRAIVILLTYVLLPPARMVSTTRTRLTSIVVAAATNARTIRIVS